MPRLGERRATFDPTEPIALKHEGESDPSEGDSEAKQSIEFVLVWWRDAQTTDGGSLDVTSELQ